MPNFKKVLVVTYCLIKTVFRRISVKILNFFKKIIKKLLGFDNSEFIDNIVCYICGNEALPLPLEPEEELMLIEELSNNNQQAKEKLVEHNLRLVVYIAKRFDGCGIDMEDLISVGAIGLIKAINTYNLNKNIKLATYASRCIENEILMQIRKISKQKGEVSIDEPLTFDGDGNELLLSDVLCQEADVVSGGLESSVERQLLYSSLNKLNPREQYIMKLRFGLDGNEEKTQKEVAEMLGISQSYISRIEKKILGRMKKDLTNIM